MAVVIFFFVIQSIIFVALLLSPSPSLKITQIRGGQGLLPPPHYGARLHFGREKDTAILPSSTCIELRLPTLPPGVLSGGLIPLLFYYEGGAHVLLAVVV